MTALRSTAWLSGDDEVAMLHRAALRIAPEAVGRPVIGIADTSSDLNPCNVGLSDLVPLLAAEITEAGGVPVRFPVMSLGEDLMKPTAMLYRNLVAMELEETIRAYPLDGIVYLANCDKTIPASLMAAASTNIPSIVLIGGARSAPLFQGNPLGAGTALWRALDERRAGTLNDAGWRDLESCLSCAGPGACNVMGTASSMALITETLGMALPYSTGIPTTGPQLEEVARRTGRRAVELVTRGQRPTQFMTQQAIDNAAIVLSAAGGSTNVVVHLAAIANRLGLDASLRRLDRLWRDVPLLVDVEPCGRSLITDFAAAGGLPTVLRALGGLVDVTACCGDGRPWRDVLATAPPPAGVISVMSAPVSPAPVLAAVHGSLAPDGAVIKVAAASTTLLEHSGQAVVFSDYADMRERLDDPDLDIPSDGVLIVRGCGPVGAPGMPEWGMAPIPRRLLDRGVRDMLRISDGRMSGTSFGTVILHVAPEAAVGGPLALVQDGDTIRFSLAQRRVDLLVDDEELNRRRANLTTPPRGHRRGWPALYRDHVLQADRGADLDFLVPSDEDDRVFVEPVIGRS